MLSGFTIYTIVSIALKVIIFLAFLWIRRRLYVLSFKLPGPLYIPLLGNLASFLFRKGSFFQRINLIILDNKEIFRFWIGSKLLLIVRNTEAVRHFSNLTIPSNDGKRAFTQGHGILMTQQIDRWRQHKKLIKSMINVKFIIDNIDVFKKHIDRCMIRMEKHTTEATFDVQVYIRNCYIDIFGEVILGIAIESQDGKNSDLTNALQTYSNFAFKRMLLTWTHAQFLLKILPTYRKKVKAENYLMSFTEEAIIKSWERRKTSLFPASNDRKNYAIVDEIGNYIETNLDTIQNEELRDYLLSLFLVSQQSLSYVTSYCCLYLGMYPEYQSRVLNEIQSISSTTLKYEYLYKLKYLDAFIQEVLSVVTIRPFIFRNFTETILFENLTIPPECTIIIPSYSMQHDIAQNFRTFNPENVSQRASHCFGQGTKECIGKLLSMFSVKIMLVNILKYYKIETEDKPIDFKLGDDLYTQPKDGFKIRLRKRPI